LESGEVQHTREEDNEVIANDLRTELRGKIDSGGALGIVVEWVSWAVEACDWVNFSVEL